MFPYRAPLFGVLTSLCFTVPALCQTAAEVPQTSFLPPVFGDWVTQDSVLLIGVATLICLACAMLVRHRMRLRRRALRQEISGLANGPRFRMVDIVSHASWRGRTLDEVRLKRALDVARDVTDMDYEIAHLREVALRADRFILPFNFWWMRADLNRDEKLVLFNAATSVMVASGRLSRADQRFLGVLSRSLGLKRSDLRDLARIVKD